MYLNLVLLTCFLVYLQPTISSAVPTPKKCQTSDSKCIKSSAQEFIPYIAAGIPELGIEKMDPMIIKYLDGSTPTIKLILRDVTLTGLSQCQAKKLQFSNDNTKLTVKILCTVEGNGQYDMDGQLLLLQIKGNGKIHAIIRKIQIMVDADIKEELGADGLPHWAVGQWKHSYVFKEKASLELENLFNGNELLGRATKELIDNNPNDLLNEVAPPLVKAIGIKIIDNIKKLFHKIPLKDLTV